VLAACMQVSQIHKMSNKIKFGKIRKKAFKTWKEYTGRSGKGYNENIAGTYECDWQNKADKKYSMHISVFCSLGEWASNISDILKDKSLDNLDLLNINHRQALYRYYTRLLLVESEMLTDFQNIFQVSVPGLTGNKVRQLLSTDSEEKEINNLIGFINTVCKHKTANIHSCNHHLNIWFEDTGRDSRYKDQIKIGYLNFDKTKRPVVVVPQLEYFINILIQCYHALDSLYNDNDLAFEEICDKYH